MKTKLTKKQIESIKNLNVCVYGGMYEYREIKKKIVLDTIVVQFDDEKWVLVDEEPNQIINKEMYDTWYCYDLEKWWIRDYYPEVTLIKRTEKILSLLDLTWV